MRLAPGTKLGDYVVTAPLGAGGMGAVFEALDLAGRRVAVKVLAAGAGDDLSRQRFAREAEAAARVNHPNVARVHAAGFSGKMPFIAFELVGAGSLARKLRSEGPLGWKEAATLLGQAARGVAAIHAAGLVHRDLKPGNILIDEEGRAKIADLGLVRLVAAMTADELTQPGDLLGTPAYMAPEQIERARDAGPRADVYGLGATLFAALTGRPPFEGKDGAALILRVLVERPVSPSSVVEDLPPALEELILECLAKDPARRPQSALEVARRLEAIAKGDLHARSGRTARFVVSVAAAAALAGAAAAIGLPGAAPPPPARPGSASPRHEVTARLLLAEAKNALDAERGEEAVAAATSALAADPGQKAAFAVRAAALELLFRPEEARRDAERALADDERGEALAARAAAFADERAWEKARDDARAAIPLLPPRSRGKALAVAVAGEAEHWLAWPEGRRGDDRVFEKTTGCARDAGREARQICPSLGRADLVCVLGDRHAGLPPQACEEAIRRGRAAAPRNPWGSLFLAELLEAEGRSDEAIEELLAARRAADWPELHAALALVSRDRDPASADLESRRALELDPRAAVALAVRARLARGRGALDEAAALAGKACTLEPRSALAALELGLVFAAQRDLPQAHLCLERAVKMDDTFGEAWVALGESYAAAGHTDEAVDRLTSWLDERLPDGKTRADRSTELEKRLVDACLERLRRGR